MKTLKGQITAFSIGICLLTGISFISFSYYQNKNHLLETKINETHGKLEKVSKAIMSRLNEVRGDALFLSSTPPIAGIMRAKASGNYDPVENTAIDLWKKRLKTIFEEMLYVKEDYLQLRYIGIDDGGREIVRVDRKKNKIISTSESDLQRKGKETYFKEALKYSSSKVYLSSFNYNRERGKVEYPLVMVLRAAVPIFKSAYSPFGMLVINVDYSAILNSREWNSNEGGEVYIFDDEEKLLFDSNNFDDNSKKQQLSINKLINIVKRGEGSLRSRFDEEEHSWLVHKLYYNQADPSKYLVLVAKLNQKILVKQAQVELMSSMLLLFIVTLIALTCAFFFSTYISSKVKGLMKMTQNILEGKMDEVIAENEERLNKEKDIKELSEIDMLGHTMIQMASDIVSANLRLEGQNNALNFCALIFEMNPDGEIIYVNDNLIKLSKYKRSYFIGENYFSLISDSHKESFFMNMWNTIARGDVWNGEVTHRDFEGKPYWVKKTIYPVKNENGDIERFISIAFDVSERVLAEKEVIAANENIISQKEALDSSAIVAETDTKGQITYVNERLITISGYTRDELIGKDHRLLNSGHHPKSFFKNLWNTIKSGRVWTGEIQNRTKNGKTYWVDTTIYPYRDSEGVVVKFIAIRFDITDKKLAQAELETANLQAKSALEAKSSFLANMSHEIRTPLNGIIGFSNLLLEKTLPQESLDQVRYIKDCSEGLLSVINDVLDFSKIEAGKFNIEIIDFNLKETVESAINIFKLSISEKNISMILNISDDIPHILIGDPLRIRQILLNLIGNAVKFTGDNGEIEISISCYKGEGKVAHLEFMVRDNGIGIPLDKQKNLFSSFEQVDNTIARKYGGTGLGLAISERLIELMEGRIWFESFEGEGTSFFFTLDLPYKIAAAKIGSHDKKQKRTEDYIVDPDLKILVAEDNPTNQKLISSILKKFICSNVKIVDNGQMAVDAVKENYYDIVFMDIQMPILDGYQATTVIRNELKSSVTIYGLSANAFSEDKQKAMEVGMDGYIEKPIKVSKIGNLLAKISEAKKAS